MYEILRVIDANFNRAREGLRTIEDGIRFYYNLDKSLIKKVKHIRHALSIAVDRYFGLSVIKKGRDTIGDRGKDIDNRDKQDIKQLIERNFMRVSEAMRVMEEYSRLTIPSASQKFHNLRFNLYNLEKEVLLSISKKDIPIPFVSVLLNLDTKPSLSNIKKIIDCKPDMLMLCYPGDNQRFFLNMANKIRKIVPPSLTYLICGRPDICILCDADGVFLNRKDLPYREVKELLQDRVILTDELKIVNIPVKETNINQGSHLKKLLKDDMDGIILIIGKDIPEKIETIINMIIREVKSYGKRRKKTARKE
ncbi:MAG: thiamine phosphate synthase [bacterium]|nr:thiamine phosphate synthase [bacterium]